jgi:hypothetical protein
MKTKFPKQQGRFQGKEDHQYAPLPKINLHPKCMAKS